VLWFPLPSSGCVHRAVTFVTDGCCDPAIVALGKYGTILNTGITILLRNGLLKNVSASIASNKLIYHINLNTLLFGPPENDIRRAGLWIGIVYWNHSDS
jgi:hypothetical protein